MVVGKLVLRLEPKPVADRKVLAWLPVILRVKTKIDNRRSHRMEHLRDGELAGLHVFVRRRTIATRIQQAVVRKRSIRSRRRSVRIAVGPQSSTQPNEVLRKLNRGVVLRLQVNQVVRLTAC